MTYLSESVGVESALFSLAPAFEFGGVQGFVVGLGLWFFARPLAFAVFTRHLHESDSCACCAGCPLFQF